MTSHQNILERIKDQLSQGLINAEEANIRIVEDMRFKVIQGRLNSEVRKALKNGVLAGRLEHLKKDDLKPEVYCKVGFKFLAIEERNRIANEAISKIKSVCI